MSPQRRYRPAHHPRAVPEIVQPKREIVPPPPQEPDYTVQAWAEAEAPTGLVPGYRIGTVALAGQPNAGKSTLLNRLLGEKLAIVSQRPQTTRDNLRGILTTPDAQMVLLDTPGIHKARSPLNRAMIGQAVEALETADVVVIVVDAQKAVRWMRDHAVRPVVAKPADTTEAELPEDAQDHEGFEEEAAKLQLDQRIHPGDRRVVFSTLRYTTKYLIALNKVDIVKPRQLLPVMEALATLPDIGAIVPVSAWTADGLRELLKVIRTYLPEGQPEFAADELTDRPLRWLCAELVREQVFQQIRDEVPYGVVCETELYEELADLSHVQVLVHVEKSAQRAILVGKDGARMKALASAARAKMQTLIGRKVFLEVHVRIEPRWSERADKLKEFGYLQ